MKRIVTFFILVFAFIFAVQSQTAIVPCGGDISHSSGTVSYTVGQIDYIYKNRDSLGVLQPYSAWEGVQQVYPVLQLVYDTICPGDSYALHGFNIGPFLNPGSIVDTIFVQSVVNAMNDSTITIIPPDTMKVLYLTIRTLHTLTPDGYFINIIAGNYIPSTYSHLLGNGANAYTTTILPNNTPNITTIQIGNSFIYGFNPITVPGTYYAEFTTSGVGCPNTFTDTIHVMDSLLCSIINMRNDVSCALGNGTATVNATGGSGVYNYLWMPSGQRTAHATGLYAGTYVVTVTDSIMGQTVTATVIIDNDPFIVVITADDTTLCTGESTQLHTQIIGGNNSVFFDYYWNTLGPGTIDSRYIAEPTVTMVGTIGTIRTYQVEVMDAYYCTATASISFLIQCETPPSASWTIIPNGGGSPVPYDDNLAINVYNPQPGINVDADCGYLYRINGGAWLPWTNTSIPIIISGNDIFVGNVTFEIKHNDTCSSGLITTYTWDITPPIGSIAYTRDTWWNTVCIGHDSLRLTDVSLQSFDASTQIYEWMYAYHFHNGTQDSITWIPLTQLNDSVGNFNTPYVPVDQSVNNTPTQPGDTIFISVRVQHTADGGSTWSTVESTTTFWVIQDNPSFNIANLSDGTVCEDQTHSFYVESSQQGTIAWSYGVTPVFTHAPITGTISEFDYLISTHPTNSLLNLYDFSQSNLIEISAILTPTNGSCPIYRDTALLTINPIETLTLITDSSTISQEFCLHNSVHEIRYAWGGGADTAVLTWNNVPAGVQVSVQGNTLIISGTPLTSGTFSYTITTQGNCTPARGSGTIKVNTLPVFSINTQQIACHGEASGFAGINLITLLGFENDYTFTWYDHLSNVVDTNSQAHNLYAGTYSVNVTLNATGCSSTASVTLNEPVSSVVASVVGSDVTCHGGNNGLISVTPSGGTAPYRISIYDTNDLSSVIRGFNNVPAGANRTATNLTAGTYAAYIFDANNCLFTATVTISEPPALNITLLQEIATTCYDSDDGLAEIVVSGGTAPYQYAWSNGDTTALISGLSPGIYYVTTTDANGCSASRSANITRPSRITAHDTIVACGTYIWNSISYNHSGRYTQILTAPNGCDSTVTLYLTILQNTSSSVSVSVCGSYTWPVNQTLYTQSGVYTHTIVGGNSQGCDSTITLNLSIDATATIDIFETACATYTWALNQVTYTQSGTFSHSVPSQNPGECDTTYILHLTITAPITTHIYVNSCGDYLWNLDNTTYTQSGEYTYTLDDGDPNTCDSVFVLHLYIPQNPLHGTINYTDITCFGKTDGRITTSPIDGTAPYIIYIYDTTDMSSSIRGYTNVPTGASRTTNALPHGTYLVEIIDHYGCTYTQLVTIVEPNLLTSQFAITACDSYTWEGTTYTASGNYTKTLFAQNGCDSIVTLNLTINRSTTSTINVNSCNNSYTWNVNGQTYTQSGTYTDTIHGGNAYGCDSIVTLQLYVPASLLHATITSTNVNCYGNNNGTITIAPTGGTASYIISVYDINDLIVPINRYTSVGIGENRIASNLSAGIYAIEIEDQYGCTYSQQVTLTQPTQLIANASVTQPISCYQAADGAVSVAVTGGTAPYTYLWQNGNTTNAISGLSAGNYSVTVTDDNGCTAVASISLTEPNAITSQFTMTACDAYTWEGTTYTASGNHIQTLTSQNGCDSIVTMNLTIYHSVTSTINVNNCSNSYTWSVNGQTYTQSGQYSYTITGGSANGCDSIVTLNLHIPVTPISANISSTNISCFAANDGTITIAPIGGDAPYSIAIFDINDLSSSIRGYTAVALGNSRTATGLPAGTYVIEVTDQYGCTYSQQVILTQPTQLVANATITQPISCYQAMNGAVSVAVTGGTAPYTYLWQNGNTTNAISGLSAGNYSVTVTDDNGCTAVASISLTEPNAITSQFTMIACDAYTWEGTTYTASGNHIQTLTSQNGCDSIVTMNLTIYHSVTSTINVNNCSNSYTWSVNGQTYTQSGQYSYTITGGSANGCDSIVTLNLHIPVTPISANISSTNISCFAANDGTITIAPIGGDAPYSIAIFDINDLSSSIRGYTAVALGNSRTATGLPAGTYVIEVTDQYGCTYSQQVILTQPTQLVANATITQPISCYQAMNGAVSVAVTGGTAPYTYLWQNGNTTNAISGLSAGNYSVTVTDDNGCTVVASISLTEPNAITSQFTMTACDSYTWEGSTYTASGNHTKTLTSQNGCDSIVTLNLTVYRSSNSIINVNTCSNSYTWSINGQTYTQSGQYSYTITGGSANGCDSIVTLNLHIPVTPISANISSTNISCFAANDGTITIAPIGGDAPYSIAIFDINDLSSSIRGYTAVALGNSRTATGLPAGTYVIEVTDQYGCTYSQQVILTQPTQLVANATITQPISCYQAMNGAVSVAVTGGTAPYTYLWQNGNTTNAISGLSAGNYSVTVTDNNGCTAVASISLTEPNLLSSQFTITACDSYTWEGTVYTVSGNYTKTLTAHNGCDSIVTLHLTINRSAQTTIYESACQSYTWNLNGQTYTQSGQYSYTIIGGSANGCDSIVTLSLYIPSSPLTANISAIDALCYGNNSGRITVTVSGGTANYDIDIYNINDLGTSVGQFNNVSAFTQKTLNYLYAGTYQVEIFDHNGCIYTATVTINQPTQLNLSLTSQNTTCYGGADGAASISVTGGTTTYQYLWSNGAQNSAITNLNAGYYTVQITDGNGCTAMASTTIAQPNRIVHEFYVTNCDSYTWNSVQYTNSGRYTNVFTNANGCDSTAILNLTITHTTTSHIYVSACNAYQWFGNDYNQSGTYTHTLQGANSQGCDSIITLHLTINIPTHGHIYHSSCGDYLWNYQLCSTTGEYLYTISGGNAMGCDSIVHLHLTVGASTLAAVYDTACVSYTWNQNNVTYTQSGNYTDTIYNGNVEGCDSIVTLHLTINQPTTGEMTVVSCVSYLWSLNGQTYTQSGNYNHTITNGNANGCDSTVTLHLTINQPTNGSITLASCVSYTWDLNDETYSQSGNYSHTIIGGNANGCDSIVTLHLTINQPTEFHMYDTACVEYRWSVSNETYYATGDYEYIIEEGNANGCDSTIILHLVINQPSVGEITVITYQPYTWDVTGETYGSSGIYSYTYYGGASNGCDSTVILNLTVNAVGIEDQQFNEMNITLYPNPTRNYVDIIIDESIEVKEAAIFDMYGKLLNIEKIVDKHPRISFETYANGIYLLRLNDGKQVVKSFKVIKN